MPAVSENHTRRLSSESSFTDDEPPDLPESAQDSSAALILLHDSEESNVPLDFTDDEDTDRDESSNLVSPVFDMRKSTVFPPLRPSLVFLYLLAPYLKLGALDLINSRLPLEYGLLALFTSALASVYSRQVWYRLARYLRKADITEIVLDTFARRRSKERRRMVLRASVKAGNGILSILVAVTYLRRECLDKLVSHSFMLIKCHRCHVPTAAIISSKASTCRDLRDHDTSHRSHPWLSILRQISPVETDNLCNIAIHNHLCSLDWRHYLLL